MDPAHSIDEYSGYGESIEMSNLNDMEADTTQVPNVSRIGLVKNGICIKSVDERWYFDYNIGVKSEELNDTQLNSWTNLSTQEKSGQSHWRCLWLNEVTPSLLDSVSDTSATVVLVINNIDSFELDGWVYENCSLPIVALCSSSGHVIKSIFDKSLESQVSALVSRRPLKVEIVEHSEPGIRATSRDDQITERSSKSLYDRVIGCLSDCTKVSDIDAVFALIISEFRMYEQHKQARDGSDIKKVLDVLIKRITTEFEREFPYYFCLVGQMSKARHICTDVNADRFKNLCAEKLEELHYEVVASTLENFFSRVEDKNILTFLDIAFEKIGKKKFKSGTTTTIYPVMLWISVTLKIKLVLSTSDETISKESLKWDQALGKMNNICELNIPDVNRGQRLGFLLNLPNDLQFSYKHLLQLMSPTTTNKIVHVPTFQEQINALNAMPNRLSEEQFIEYVSGVIEYYKEMFRRKFDPPIIKQITRNSTNSAAIEEGIKLMDHYHSFLTKKGWDQAKFDIESWLSQLSDLINFKHNPQHCIRVMFSQDSEVVMIHRRSLITNVTKLTEGHLKSMSIAQFNDVLKCCDIWERPLVAEFLQNFSIHSQLKLRDCEPLLTTLIERPRLTPDCSLVWDFFIRFARKGYYSKVTANFIFDLLKLKLPKLFINTSLNTLTKEGLEKKLCDHIKSDERTPRALLTSVDALLTSIQEEWSDEQMIVLSAVRKETMAIRNRLLVVDAVEKMALQLMESVVWVDKTPNQRELFCLDFITSYICKIEIDEASFQWVSQCEHDKTAVLSIIKVYGNYLEKSKCQPSLRQIPESAQRNASESVKKLFQWILKIENFLFTWKEKFQNGKINYDQIMVYKKHQKLLQSMSSCMVSEDLVCSEKKVKEAKAQYETDFKELNSLLLKPVPGDGQRKTCSVMSALQKFNLHFPESIQQTLTGYVRFPSDKMTPLNWNPVRNVLLVREEQCVQISHDLLLSILSKLVHDLTSFLHPLMDYLDILTFFHERPKSVMFNTYLRNHAKAERDRIENKLTDDICDEYNYLGAFFNALQKTIALIKKIISGEATYGESVIDHELDLNTLDVISEFNALMECPNLARDCNIGEIGLICMLELMQFEAQYYDPIISVCKQYHFETFDEDQQLRKVNEIILDVRNKENFYRLTAAVAQEKWQYLEDILKIKGKNMDCLTLFTKIADCVDFYHFLKERNFVGPNCAEDFRRQLRLIDQQIEHDMTDHDMMVMDHLDSSISFMAPFLDQTQTFEMLMTSLSVLDTTIGLSQLDTVRSNMHRIHVWFSKAQDNLENVAVELDCIWSNGSYCFDVANETLLLKFEPSQVIFSLPGNKVTYWKEEQVKDFIHKLGFLECNEEQKKKQDAFMAVTDTAHKIMKIFVNLRDKGHPKYFMAATDAIEDLPCSCDTLKLNEKIMTTQKTLSDWNIMVQELHSKYKWLLFFRIPKLMQVCKYLQFDSTATLDTSLSQGIYQEIQFLLERKRNNHPEKHITAEIKEAFALARQESDPKAHLKMKLIGSILRIIFTEKGYSIRGPTITCKPSEHVSMSVAATKSDTLFSISEISSSKTINIMLNIYNGAPESFEYLRCSLTTTEEELRIFMKRVLEHPRIYTILHVNYLPHFLQEVLLKDYIEFRQQVVHTDSISKVYFVETAPSVLREIPWLELVSTEDEPFICRRENTLCQLKRDPALKSVELVYGDAGDGKTHYIRKKLLECHDKNCRCTIVINETFSLRFVIERLRRLPNKDCRIHFNITSLLTNDTEMGSHRLADEIGWFFFDLLLLGYIEDPPTGLSFSFPCGTSWNLYIEIPCRTSEMSAEQNLKEFEKEFPVVGLIGSPKPINSERPFEVDDEVQLVCKYLKRFESDKINITLPSAGRSKIKFSNDPKVSDDECRRLLNKYMEKHYIKNNKTDQKLFVRYMKRRCSFLDNLPGFNFNYGGGYIIDDKGEKKNTNTTKLGSTLMSSMLKEVEHFCDPRRVDDWAKYTHQQLIYDIDPDGGGAIGLISLNPEQISQANRAKFVALGIKIPSMKELYERTTLDEWLSRALGLKHEKREQSNVDGEARLTESKMHIKLIDDKNYVLTLDYTLKMLNIHERRECGIPVIIEGETGVGKTALIEMLSQLWNHSWLNRWELLKCKILLDDVEKKKDQFYHRVKNSLLEFKDDPIFSMLDIDPAELQQAYSTMEKNSNPIATAELMNIILNAKVKSVFYKLNIHAALQPHEIYEFFKHVCSHANDLNHAYSGAIGNMRVPLITVYLDEINTSSFLGILKEIITDRTIEGEPIPENIFIIAACNPLRADSLAIYRDTVSETWLKAAYCVQRLHPSLRQLVWDYGALNKAQEKQYITAKMDLLNPDLTPADCDSLNSLIIESQVKMRDYALKHIQTLGSLDSHEAELCSRSCVSQRDIQRVFTFYTWLMELYKEYNPHKESKNLFHRRAVMVALGLVYYMRLNSEYRKDYQTLLDKSDTIVGEVTFSEAYEAALDWFTEQLELPSGIAKTIALKENVFAIFVCTMTRTPLIIVGDPGTSKTLSFNIVTANLKGKESKIKLFRNTDIFKSLDPHFYQCSKRTTSKEIEKVFSRAINRQHYLAKVPLPVLSVVLMDEAGLPEREMESLKALHYYLDEQEVSFVAISNHVLDAAKTNRAVSLFRPKASHKELRELALASLINGKGDVLEKHTLLIEALVKSYVEISDGKQQDNDFKTLFGLRDFIFLVTHLRRKICDSYYPLSLQMIVEGLERNFNGTDHFIKLCEVFLKYCYEGKTNEPHFRSILRVMKESLEDSSMKETNSVHSSVQSEVRHMLIIDCSEDSSVIRLVFQRGILPYQQLRLYVCGDFPGDIHDASSDRRVNTISQIRHSVAAGHTVLMCQTEEIHECFYDLFNQRYSVINDPRSNKRHYYANIAIGAHSKPCKVDPRFRCIVVVKKEDLSDSRTPLPFLNRFEKYRISHDVIYKQVLDSTPKVAQVLIKAVYQKVNNFAETCDSKFSKYLYGFQRKDTLKSLMLTILPSEDNEYKPYPFREPDESECQLNVHSFLLKTIAKAMHLSAGFNVKMYDSNSKELEFDTKHLFQVLRKDPEHVHLNQLQHRQVPGLVDEALNVLYYRRYEDEHISVYSDTCMVISLVFHWLEMILCKRLMQLMIAEALPAICNCIPKYYIEHYLIFQSHFSLKNLISTHLRDIEQSVRSAGIPTKLMCFTRSSPLIRQLPSDFPSHGTTLHQTQIHFLQQYIVDDVESLVLCKLSSRHSQASLEDVINKFTMSKNKVLLLIVDAGTNFYQQSDREISKLKENISHLRIMIEEAELHLSNDLKLLKLFVVLIHFPPAKLIAEKFCYPALFLQGWDHFYLDTIADGTLTRSGTMASVVNVEQWLYSCLVKPNVTVQNHTFQCDEIEQNVKDILRDALPSVASRLKLRSQESNYKEFLDVSSKTTALNSILLSKEAKTSMLNPEMSTVTDKKTHNALEEGIGAVLARSFSKYWNSREMNRYLQRFTSLTFLRKSTLNLTASVETTFRSLFVNFLVYRLSRMEVTFELYMLLDDNIPQCLVQCLLCFLECLPLPKLEQLSQLSDLPLDYLRQSPKDIPNFPFLSEILKSINLIIEEVDDEIKVEFCKQLAPGVEKSVSSISQMTTNERIEKCLAGVKEKVLKIVDDESEPTLIGKLLYLLKRLPELWEHYFQEVVAKHDPQEIIRNNVFLIRYIAPFRRLRKDHVHHFIAFHVHLYVHHLDILRVGRALKPLKVFSYSESSCNSDSESFLDVDHRSDLSVYIVNKLYDFACTLETSKMKDWLNCVHQVVSIQAFVEDIFNANVEGVDRKFSLMHTTYLIASAGENDELCSVAHNFFLKMKDSFPFKDEKSIQLEFMFNEAIKVFKEMHRAQLDKCTKTFMEGFLLFNFSESRFPYPENDCEWFYKLANETADLMLMCSTYGVFQLVLTRILGFPELVSNKTEDEKVASSSKILDLFDEMKRARIEKFLLTGKKSDDIIPFIPAMYTKLDKNVQLHQPLAELYFSVVLKQLKQRNNKERHLIRLTSKLTKLHEGYLCLIEKEAVVHALLECVSSRLDPRCPSEARDLINRRLHDEIDNIISNEPKVVIEGTTEVPACLFTLAYNLQRQVKSSDWLAKQLEDDESAVIQVFPAIKPLHMLIQPQSSEGVYSQMLLGREISQTTILCKLYEDLTVTLLDIHKKNWIMRPASENKLMHFIEEYSRKCVDNRITCGGICFDKICALQMILWNCIYYNFYEKKISSQAISDVLRRLKPKYLEDCVLVLLQSFAFPQIMCQRLESTYSGHADEDRYRLTSSLRMEPKRPSGERRDPLFDLFSPKHSTRWKEDPLDTSLRQSLSHLVAATLASGRSSHLWYHMFESDELLDTHMTGFMYDHKVTSAHKYDCGVELSQDGLHGRPDYKVRADKNHLSLHSWYSILWANFGAFCMGLITQQDSHEKIGVVLSEHHSDIRHVCVAQMKNFWLHICLALNRTTEDISFFIRRAMALHVKTCSSRQEHGKFLSVDSVSSYEEIWHNDVYTASYNDLTRFDKQRTSEGNPLQEKLRQIGLYTPYFPTEQEFTQALQISTDGSESRQKRHPILYEFTMEYTRLKMGAKVLPDLIKFYNWIHKELKCLVDKNYALDNDLEEIITKGDKIFPKLGLSSLYEKVSVGYNEYVDCIGHHIGEGACANVKRGGHIYHLKENTKLYHMLSVDKETSGDDDDHDGWLLLVIMDIIRHHNVFLNKVHSTIRSDEQYTQLYTNADVDFEVLPEEVEEMDCIIGHSDRFLQLIRCRHILSDETHTFDYDKLEKDIVEDFILGKPMINEDKKNICIPFKFLKPMAVVVGVGISEADVEALSSFLGEEFKCELNDKSKKELECQLHAADHNKLNEIASGLLVSANHLVKECLHQSDGLINSSTLIEQDLRQFLQKLYKQNDDVPDEIILENIGIKNLTANERVCLIRLRVKNLYAALKHMVQRIQVGVYDFCHLPLAMKKHIYNSDEIIKDIHSKFATSESNEKLLLDVKNMSKALIHCEMELQKNNKHCQEPLMPYIKKMNFVDEEDELPDIIPVTVLGAHYVSLHLLLRRVTDHCKRQSIYHKRWDDFTPELWAEGNLKYLRDVALPFDQGDFVYDPDKDCFAFQEEYMSSNSLQEGFVFCAEEEAGNSEAKTDTSNTKPPGAENESVSDKMDQSKLDIKNVTKQEIGNFLRGIDLEQYVELFVSNGVDGELLVELTKEELKDLGVTNAFHQKKIITNFARYLKEKGVTD